VFSRKGKQFLGNRGGCLSWSSVTRTGSKMSELFVLECNETIASESGNEIFGDRPFLWVAGIACSCFSSLATAIGTILQKKAHMVQETLPDEEKSHEIGGIVLNRYWFAALAIMVLVPLPFDFASFALAPQSVIVPISGLTIVLNQVLSPLMLGETLTHVEIVGTTIILVGVILTSASAGGNPTSFTVCELIGRYGERDFLIVCLLVLSLMGVNMFWVHTRRHPVFLERLRPEMLAFIAGCFGGFLQLGFKALGELAKGEIGPVETNTWRTLWPYIHILVVPLLGLIMISYVNRGLQAYDSILFTPLFFTNLIVLSSTLGLIYYEEFEGFIAWQFTLFPLGIIVIVFGIAFMTLKGVNIEEVRAREDRLMKSKENRRILAATPKIGGNKSPTSKITNVENPTSFDL